MKANAHGQLGLTSVDVPLTVTNRTSEEGGEKAKKKVSVERMRVDLPRAGVDLRAVNSPYNRAPYMPDYDMKEREKEKLVVDDSDIRQVSADPSLGTSSLISYMNGRFCDQLYEVPALKGVSIAQIVAGGRHSFVRTDSGRVLGWGANEYG
jgi:hypothetical protein